METLPINIQDIIQTHVDAKNTDELLRIVDKYGVYYNNEQEIYNLLSNGSSMCVSVCIMRSNKLSNFYDYIINCLLFHTKLGKFNDHRYFSNVGIYTFAANRKLVTSRNYKKEIVEIQKLVEDPTHLLVFVAEFKYNLVAEFINKNIDKFMYKNGRSISKLPDIITHKAIDSISLKPNVNVNDLDDDGILTSDVISAIDTDHVGHDGIGAMSYLIFKNCEFAYRYGFYKLCVLIMQRCYIINRDMLYTRTHSLWHSYHTYNKADIDIFRLFLNNDIFLKPKLDVPIVNDIIQLRDKKIKALKASGIIIDGVVDIVGEYIMY